MIILWRTMARSLDTRRFKTQPEVVGAVQLADCISAHFEVAVALVLIELDSVPMPDVVLFQRPDQASATYSRFYSVSSDMLRCDGTSATHSAT